MFLHSSDHLWGRAPSPKQDNLQRPETRERTARWCRWAISSAAFHVSACMYWYHSPKDTVSVLSYPYLLFNHVNVLFYFYFFYSTAVENTDLFSHSRASITQQYQWVKKLTGLSHGISSLLTGENHHSNLCFVTNMLRLLNIWTLTHSFQSDSLFKH